MASQLTETAQTNIALISGITGQVITVAKKNECHVNCVYKILMCFFNIFRMDPIWQNSSSLKAIRCMEF